MSYKNDIVTAIRLWQRTSLFGGEDIVNRMAADVRDNFAAFFVIHRGSGRGKS